MTTFVDSINGDFRPQTYFWAYDLKVKLLSDIAGAERRRLYEAAVAAGEPSLFLDAPEFSAEYLESDLRQTWGRFHPSHLGGEYLPRRRNEEVEIARIVIDSTTSDVTCVYAKRGKNRIYYKVVDEYGGDTLSNAGTRTSKQPLTLGQLVDFFLGSWDLLNVLEVNFGHHGYPLRQVHGFLLDVQSDFYPDLEGEVRRRVDVWLATERGEPLSSLDSGDEEYDGEEQDNSEDLAGCETNRDTGETCTDLPRQKTGTTIAVDAAESLRAILSEEVGGGSFSERHVLPSGLAVTYAFSLATGFAAIHAANRYRLEFVELPGWVATCHPTHRRRLCDWALLNRRPLPDLPPQTKT